MSLRSVTRNVAFVANGDSDEFCPATERAPLRLRWRVVQHDDVWFMRF